MVKHSVISTAVALAALLSGASASATVSLTGTSTSITLPASQGSFSELFDIDLGAGTWDVVLTFSGFERRSGSSNNWSNVGSGLTLTIPTGYTLLSSNGGVYQYTLTGVTDASALTTFTLQGNVGNSGSAGVRFNGSFSATAVSPVPEPETYALMLAGLGVVGWAARRRKQAPALPAQALPA